MLISLAMYVFIDETGDHDLIHIDEEYPVFGLGALMIEEGEYRRMEVAVNEFKTRYFDSPETFILHACELKRPTNKKSDPRNRALLNPIFRKGFYEDFDNSILNAFDYKVAFCFIRKKLMATNYQYPSDPYHFSFENILNRILRHGGQLNDIFAEKRGEDLNVLLEAEYERMKKIGIRFYNSNDVVSRTNLGLIDKNENISGLQVIDLLLSAVTRKHQGKGEKMIGNDCNPDFALRKLACPITFFPYKKP